jgi:hypothetical protein
MTIGTSGGTFWIDEFGPYAKHVQEIVYMRMRFEANAFVDATHLGFVQVARILIEGRPHAPSSAQLARGIPENDPDAGAFVDCTENDRNPVYGLTLKGGAGSDNSLTQGRLSAGLSVLGRHRLAIDAENADSVLEDYTEVPLIYRDCSVAIETAALALAGPDYPQYYGSITWGWERNGGIVQLHAPSLPSNVGGSGVSVVFHRAVECWNAAADAAASFRLLKLPVP